MDMRSTLNAVFTSAACLVLGGPATLYAQGDSATAGFPRRPVRVVVPFTPGGQPGLPVRKLPYDTRKDFAGITMIYNTAYLLVVPPALGMKTVQELIALAKSRPGQLNLASAGAGSGAHFAGLLFRPAAGT